MTRPLLRRLALPATLAPVLLVAACSSGAAGAASDAASDGTLTVVASTDVWGDVAAQVAGEHAEVTSVITDPSADPHSFELTARDQLAVSRADLVVMNGGHYDEWMGTALGALDAPPAVVDAVGTAGGDEHAGDEHAGDEHAEEEHAEEEHAEEEHGEAAAASAAAPSDGHDHGDEANEHVWYDLHVAAAVAQAVADALSDLDADHAADYEANAAAFVAGVEGVEAEAAELATVAGGTSVAATEPVPAYLLAAAGLVDATPAEYAQAIEEETDVPPAAMRAMLDLLSSRTAAVLVENAQTSGPQTEEAVTAAEAAGVPVVAMTETLPEGEDYVSWMSANVAALRQALGA
ncbi:metal ABC transporter solute-binding protein, Zn/Mn family [Cellulomonas endophytica]|uniref:metal ABC transporter solute-binding protein, Zn/Mn family n=1 Tax=Cellulomonas endophytica TaxID=2494735 RepID=UPI001F0CABD2|nr:zinc ABC transporter substrate-binding protein [Cellulomonas endophytica]